MTTRSAAIGNEINLRARFLDDLSVPDQASGVVVHIYPPDVDDYDLINADLISGIATYLGQGIYEYKYTIPEDGETGTWTDRWVGELNGQTLDELLNFSVYSAGFIEELPSQLYPNNIVSITLTSGIKSLDYDPINNPMSLLHDSYTSEFLTQTTPSYTNIRKVRLEIGSYINNVWDDTVQQAILEASLDADAINFVKTGSVSTLYQHARREYVTCLASKILLTNIVTPGGLLKSKTLADLSVSYDTDALRDALNRVQDCLNRWEPQVEASGLSVSLKQPMGVVKGEYDPDRVIPGRMWESTDENTVSRRMPAANTVAAKYSNRRTLKTWKRRW